MIRQEDKEKILDKFVCQKTGNCCRTSGYVYATEKEIDGMATLLEITNEKFKELYVRRENGWNVIASERHRTECFLNKKNECQVYAERPGHCRSYPNWPEIWEDETSLIKETCLCPALKKAYFEFKSDKTEKTIKKSV